MDIHISDMDILNSDMNILRGTYLYIYPSLGVHIYTIFTDMYTNRTTSTCQLKKWCVRSCMDLGGFIQMSHEIDKHCLSIFLARKFDFWSQWIQWIYIEFYRYPQAMVWNYMNFNRYPHIGRGPTCR